MGRDGFRGLVGVAVLFAGLSSIIAPAASLAMEIRRSANGSEIHLSGKVEIGDFEKFEAVADTAEKNARVSLTSPGGRLDVALMIGERIRKRGLSTTVPDGAICTSACGLIWLAGTSRFVEGNGRVGFHAVFVAGRKSISGPGNALVGSYMARLGFSDPAIAYATEAGPRKMRWLTPSKASSLKIAVTWNKRLAKEEAERLAQEEAEPKASEEAERKAQRKALEERVRKGLEAERQAKAETAAKLPGTTYATVNSDGKVLIGSVDATWNIQLGSYPTRKAAQDALYAERRASPRLFANKQAFTVEVTRGQETKFRARMSGFTAKTAKRACRVLARKGIDCAAVAPQSQVQEEAERQAKTEADPKAREEARRKAQEEVDAYRKALEETIRKGLEAERQAKAEADRRAREEADRKAQEEPARQAGQEAYRKMLELVRKAREDADREAREKARQAQEEAAHQAQEEAERPAKAEADRKDQRKQITDRIAPCQLQSTC